METLAGQNAWNGASVGRPAGEFTDFRSRCEGHWAFGREDRRRPVVEDPCDGASRHGWQESAHSLLIDGGEKCVF